MDSYPFIVAKATLLFLTAVLIVEYAIRRRKVSRELVQNRQKQQQLSAYSAELKNLKKELARKSEIAEMLPQVTKKMTEKLPSDAYPAIAVRSLKEFFHAKKVGYFAPVEGSSDYSLVVEQGSRPTGWTRYGSTPARGSLVWRSRTGLSSRGWTRILHPAGDLPVVRLRISM